MKGIWNGYETEEFEFEGQNAIVVFAKDNVRTDKWLFKTEYFDAFPDFQIEMLSQGYNLAHVDNATRWCLDSDTERQAAFARYLHTEYGFFEKCVPIGMSCGGMQAIFLAAKHPELVSAIYLDAPVVNFLSCPAGFGSADDSMFEEFYKNRGINKMEILSFRHHPLDYLDTLAATGIPVILICSDSDTVVPYTENGKLVFDCYTNHGCTIEQIIKPGCDHHPHSLQDNTPIVDFVKKYYL